MDETAISYETLLDAFIALYTDGKACSNSEHITGFVSKCKYLISDIFISDKQFCQSLQSLRVNTHDFDIVKTLATGAIGKVCLVKFNQNGGTYAMKILKKIDLLTRREVEEVHLISTGSLLYGRARCACSVTRILVVNNFIRIFSG